MEERQRNSASTEGKAASMGWPIHCPSPDWCLLKECHMAKQAEWFGISNASISLFSSGCFPPRLPLPCSTAFILKDGLCVCAQSEGRFYSNWHTDPSQCLGNHI